MKKLKILSIIAFLIMLFTTSAYAMNVEEAINSQKLEKHSEYLEVAYKVTSACEDSAVEVNALKDVNGNREAITKEMIEELRKYFAPGLELNFDRSFIIYQLYGTKYVCQYENNDVLEYVLKEPIVALKTKEWRTVFDKDGFYGLAVYSGLLQDDVCYENLLKYDEMQAQLDAVNAGEILECKLLEMYHRETAVYFKCENGNYVIFLAERDLGFTSEGVGLEPMKLYTASEFFKILGDAKSVRYGILKREHAPTAEMLIEKPTYDDEAEALQAAGLMQGNENGLDLLKPLTRAEAVTLLVRAMGLEGETANYPVSPFSDIASDNWASPYAALAKSRGIANGISETEFAPNDSVTADQFATFALRAAGESGFDYTEGVEMLINKGIITEGQAETMDLFTRGDMAKIVYEAREKGMLK